MCALCFLLQKTGLQMTLGWIGFPKIGAWLKNPTRVRMRISTQALEPVFGFWKPTWLPHQLELGRFIPKPRAMHAPKKGRRNSDLGFCDKFTSKRLGRIYKNVIRCPVGGRPKS